MAEYNYFYKNLKHLRKKKKMSMEKFGKLINQSSANISRWENKNNGISLDTAWKICKFFNISLDDMINKKMK